MFRLPFPIRKLLLVSLLSCPFSPFPIIGIADYYELAMLNGVIGIQRKPHDHGDSEHDHSDHATGGPHAHPGTPMDVPLEDQERAERMDRLYAMQPRPPMPDVRSETLCSGVYCEHPRLLDLSRARGLPAGGVVAAGRPRGHRAGVGKRRQRGAQRPGPGCHDVLPASMYECWKVVEGCLRWCILVIA